MLSWPIALFCRVYTIPSQNYLSFRFWSRVPFEILATYYGGYFALILFKELILFVGLPTL